MGFGSRRPFSSASPSGSNNTNTGRPPLWTSSSQRKVSRLYLYTTLPLQKIIEVVHSKSPDTAPGKESANKKLNSLLDKEPRWLHPRTESDMGRRLNELALSPTRSLSTRSSETPPPQIAPEPVMLHPNPTYTPPAPAPAPAQGPPYGQRQTRPPTEPESHGPLSGFLRRTTFMSNSTQGTTSSLQRLLPDYPADYVRIVKRLVKRYTAPINHRGDSLSPISDMGPDTQWTGDSDAPPILPNKPHYLPGDFLNLDQLLHQQGQCFPETEQHKRRSCLCFARDDIVNSRFVNAIGLTYDAQQLIQRGISGVDLGVCDEFNNTILHFLAARGMDTVHHLFEAIGHCGPILNNRNTAGQTFVHVLNRGWFLSPEYLSRLLQILRQRNFDINARDHWGRTLFHLLLADDIPRQTFDQLIAHYPELADYMKRDAFNVTPPAHASEPVMGIRPVYTQTMDLDPPPPPSPIPSNAPEFYTDAAVAKESDLLAFIASASNNPSFEYVDGRNGLHCLAAATLSKSSVVKKHGLENVPLQGDQKRKRTKEPRDLDSCTERLNLRRQLLEGLLQAGVDPNHYDSEGNTPLMAFAALLPEEDDYKVGPEILDRLIAAGAEVNARNRSGETALHIAVRCGRKLAMRTLVKRGANVHARDSAGRSMLEVADVKMRSTRGENPKEYAHFEACRAWLSGKGMAVQEPKVTQEWGPVAQVSNA